MKRKAPINCKLFEMNTIPDNCKGNFLLVLLPIDKSVPPFLLNSFANKAEAIIL
jgi:hypothetical protein